MVFKLEAYLLKGFESDICISTGTPDTAHASAWSMIKMVLNNHNVLDLQVYEAIDPQRVFWG